MTNRVSHYTAAQQVLHQNQRRHKKSSKLKHRGVLHGLVGLVFFGFFMSSFSEFEVMILDRFEPFSTNYAESILYDIPKTTNLQQKHGESIYNIAGNKIKKDTIEIRINRKNKRDSTYLVNTPKFTPEQLAQLAARRAKQVADLDRQAALHEAALKAAQAIEDAEIIENAKNKVIDQIANNKTAISIQPKVLDLVNQNTAVPKILSSDEIAKIKRDREQQAEVNLAEQYAPMPNIHSGAVKSQFVEAMLAQVTARAHDTEVGWSAGNGKSSSIRQQRVSLDKLNGFTVVDGKLASKQSDDLADRMLLANVNVPVPLKRPKYTPKAKSKVISTSRTSLTCLTTALYHEARGQSRGGQLAVAEVISARRRSKSYPNSFCGVIYQNATKRNACQFSFACDGKTDLPRDLKTWKKLKKLAGDFLAGRASAPSVRGATHYHATYVSPKWRWSMKRLGRIGSHIFYKDPRAKA